jgi:PD-(D/E)XK nuclease superfamily
VSGAVRPFVVEHKTTSEDIAPGSTYWRRLTIDAQIDVYFDGAASLGHACEGVLYDVIRKPQLRPQLATPLERREYRKDGRLYANQRETDESVEDYERRCFEAITSEPDRYYRRATIVRLESERVEAKTDTWQTALAIRDAKHLKIWPRNPDSCVQWSRTCDYFDVCTSVYSIDDPLLFKRSEIEHEELGPKGEGLLTQSSLRCYRSCPRRYLYRYVMRARPMAPKAEPLRMGSSVHRALEEWWKTGGDLVASLLKLDQEDLYARAKERAMLRGYHLRWREPPPVVAVEAEFQMPLLNPATGQPSRTFRLGGMLDAICDLSDPMPEGDPQSLVPALAASVEEVEP